MGSTLGPTLANIFLCHREEILLKNCPKQFASDYYRRFVDDTFIKVKITWINLVNIQILDIKIWNLPMKLKLIVAYIF